MNAAGARRSWRKLRRDRVGMVSLGIILLFAVAAAGVFLGLWGQGWSSATGPRWAMPSPQHWLGTNMIGQDIFSRALQATRTAFAIGLPVAIISTTLGALMGVLSGWYGGSWIDEIILWQKGVLDAVPFYLYVAAVAYALSGHPLAMHFAMISTFWTLTARLVRAETLKLRHQPHVQAARVMGASTPGILARHVLPNTAHILLIQATLAFVTAIKAEVILSFLGLGLSDGTSWGLMIAESAQELPAGQYMNFATASVLLCILVLAFNFFADAFQQALDPRSPGL